LYEFGFGLGYTTFKVEGDLQAVKLGGNTTNELPDAAAPIEPGGNTDLWTEMLRVTGRVSNTGQRAGSTVVQLYVSSPLAGKNGIPVQALRGFKKIQLEASQSGSVEMVLRRRDISHWDVVAQQWRVPSGEFKLALGLSSRDLPAIRTVNVLG
jgi:beta-glucosidase